jgi:hypothetical protein
LKDRMKMSIQKRRLEPSPELNYKDGIQYSTEKAWFYRDMYA